MGAGVRWGPGVRWGLGIEGRLEKQIGGAREQQTGRQLKQSVVVQQVKEAGEPRPPRRSERGQAPRPRLHQRTVAVSRPDGINIRH